MYRILVVEDDRGIAQEIKRQLSAWNLEVRQAKRFDHIEEEFADYGPHLVLMDISLPFYNGYYWCQEIRKKSKVPILFISSAADNMNLVMAVQMGGDDFIAKPFDFSVLLAKVQAALRRAYDYSVQEIYLEHRGARLDLSDATLWYRGEKTELTKNEYRILQTLMEQKGRIVSREKLMERLWESDSFVDENTLSVNVNRLRRKLDSLGLEQFIATKVGLGYLIELEKET